MLSSFVVCNSSHVKRVSVVSTGANCLCERGLGLVVFSHAEIRLTNIVMDKSTIWQQLDGFIQICECLPKLIFVEKVDSSAVIRFSRFCSENWSNSSLFSSSRFELG